MDTYSRSVFNNNNNNNNNNNITYKISKEPIFEFGALYSYINNKKKSDERN